MKFAIPAISLALLLFASGCATSREVLVGGKRVVFYPAGVAVPAVEAEANAEGVYQLTACELNAILNP